MGWFFLTEPHQSPIRIQADAYSHNMRNRRPHDHNGPQKTLGSMPCLNGLWQILRLLTNPLSTHGIGESEKHIICDKNRRQKPPIKSDDFTNPFIGWPLPPYRNQP